MDFSNDTLEGLGREAKARIDTGDKHKEKADQMYTSAGLYLIEAKRRVEKVKGLTWVQYLVTNCPIGKSRANVLIEIADGRKTVEEVRTADASRKRETTAQARAYREANGQPPGQSSSKTEQKQSPQPQAARTPVDEARDEADDHHNAMLKRVIAMVKKLDDNQLTTLELKLREITQ